MVGRYTVSHHSREGDELELILDYRYCTLHLDLKITENGDDFEIEEHIFFSPEGEDMEMGMNKDHHQDVTREFYKMEITL